MQERSWVGGARHPPPHPFRLPMCSPAPPEPAATGNSIADCVPAACVPAARAIIKVRACAADVFICRARWCVARASACGACVAPVVYSSAAKPTFGLRHLLLQCVCVMPHEGSACLLRGSPCGSDRFHARRRCFCKATCVGSSRLAETSGASGASIPFAPAEYQTRLTPRTCLQQRNHACVPWDPGPDGFIR